MKAIKRNFWLILLSLTVFSCDSAQSSAENQKKNESGDSSKTSSLKILSYNIHHANPPSEEGKIDIDAIIEVIRSINPDLVALQEVDYNTERSGGENQAKLIAEALDMKYYFAKALDYDGGEYGTAILSKYLITEKETLRLPNDPGESTEDRVVAFGLVKFEDLEILFGSTHLDYKKESKSRILQVKRIIEHSKSSPIPIIIAGDFNASSGSETINLMDSEFTRTCNSCPPTIPVNNPSRAIDFIFYKHPQDKLDVKLHKVIDEKYASDHLPVYTEVIIEH